MPPSAIFEFNAIDVDARVNAGIAVLMVNADEGRVLISMTPEVLDRLVLRAQLELAQASPRNREVARNR